MKKIITSALVVSLTAMLFSCQKENLTKPAIADKTVSTGKAGPIVKDPPVPVPYILSNWFSVQLHPVSLAQNNNYLAGEVLFPGQLPDNYEVRFAYVRYTTGTIGSGDGNSLIYRQLPIDVQTSTGQVHLWFDLRAYDISTTAFSLYAANANLSIMPNPADFMFNQYRYLAITMATYQNTQVDWSNYLAVAAALGFAP
jgi:hypothetical protein